MNEMKGPGARDTDMRDYLMTLFTDLYLKVKEKYYLNETFARLRYNQKGRWS